MPNRLTILCILLSCASALGQATSQPAFGGRRGPGPGFARGARGATPQEVSDTIKWAQEHMPNLARLLSQGPRGRGRPLPLMNIAIRSMRSVEQAPPDSPARDNMLKIAAAEDSIIPTLLKLTQSADDDKPAVREEIRGQMQKIVKSALFDRAQRIARLKERLADEQRQLELDEGNIDEIVNQRVQPFFNAATVMSNDVPTTEPSNITAPVMTPVP